MKAWVLRGVNDMRLEDVPTPVPKDGELLVRVRAAGICSSDIPRVFGNGAYHYPIILGHEFSGVTEDGRRVGVFPLIPCRKCESCRRERYETCSNYSYIGSRRDGAFAEYVSVPEWNLIDLPDSVSFQQAAILEPAAVALHAVKRIPDITEKSAAVIGGGAIGRIIGAWLKRCGAASAEVLGRNDTGLLPHYDVCIEAAGSADSFRRCVEMARPNGEIILVGNPAPNFAVEQTLYWQLLRKQLTVRGSWNSSYPGDWKAAIDNVGKIGLDEVISHKFEFDGLYKALNMIYGKHEKYSKVMVVL